MTKIELLDAIKRDIEYWTDVACMSSPAELTGQLAIEMGVSRETAGAGADSLLHTVYDDPLLELRKQKYRRLNRE